MIHQPVNNEMMYIRIKCEYSIVGENQIQSETILCLVFGSVQNTSEML